MLVKRTEGRGDKKVPIFIRYRRRGAIVSKCYLLRIGSGVDQKVVLQTECSDIKSHVHSGPDIAIGNTAIPLCGNAVDPRTGIYVPNEPGLTILKLDARVGIAGDQPHVGPKHVNLVVRHIRVS